MLLLVLPGYLCHMLNIKSHSNDDDCATIASAVSERMRGKKNQPFFSLLPNYLQKAQHCLNNKKLLQMATKAFATRVFS